jgi:DNA anti-recombination protein RmuC
MKRVIYFVVAALVTTVVIAPSVAAQGETVQQAQERLLAAQAKVQEAQQYMQTPEGQQALADARASLEEALQAAQQQAQDRVEAAQQRAQDRVQAAQQYMESPEGQQALQEAQQNLQQAGQQLQKAREGAQEKMQEVTSTMERTALVKSGGPGLGSVGALAAPAVALLVGGAVLGYAVLRRR